MMKNKQEKYDNKDNNDNDNNDDTYITMSSDEKEINNQDNSTHN